MGASPLKLIFRDGYGGPTHGLLIEMVEVREKDRDEKKWELTCENNVKRVY